MALLALDVQRMAEEFGLANEANGLDRASFLESLCFEIGYAAVELPTEVVQGLPVELEFRAGLSYVGGAPDDFTAPLRTTISVSGGMASPDSLTLSDGIGTVMVTPDGPSVNVTLHTCFDYDAPPPTALQLSAVCADTTIAGHAGVVLLVSTRHHVTAHA